MPRAYSQEQLVRRRQEIQQRAIDSQRRALDAQQRALEDEKIAQELSNVFSGLEVVEGGAAAHALGGMSLSRYGPARSPTEGRKSPYDRVPKLPVRRSASAPIPSASRLTPISRASPQNVPSPSMFSSAAPKVPIVPAK